MKVRLLKAEFNTAVKYVTTEGFTNNFPITFDLEGSDTLLVVVGFKVQKGTYMVETVEGLPNVVFNTDLKAGLEVTIQRRTHGEVPHTYQYTGNAQGGSEFNAATIDENFDHLYRVVEEVNEGFELNLDGLHRLEDKFNDVTDGFEEVKEIAEGADRKAENAEEVALRIDGKAQEALDISQGALDNSELALTTAQGIDSKAQEALDKSTIASQDASNALSTAQGIDSKAQTALDNSTEALENASTALTVAQGVDNKRDLDDNVFHGIMTVKSDNAEQGVGVFLQESDGTVRGQVGVAAQGLQLNQYQEDGGLQTFTFPTKSGEVALKADVDRKWDIQETVGSGKILRGGINNIASAITPDVISLDVSLLNTLSGRGTGFFRNNGNATLSVKYGPGFYASSSDSVTALTAFESTVRVLTATKVGTEFPTNKYQSMDLMHSRNTTVDTNGFIKKASPVVKLFDTHIETNDQFPEEPVFEKVGVGTYKISNTLGLAQEGWTFEKPRGGDGTPYFRVVVEKLVDGCIVSVHDEYDSLEEVTITDIEGNLRTINRVVKVLGEARDIKPNERWIDLRFHENDQ